MAVAEKKRSKPRSRVKTTYTKAKPGRKLRGATAASKPVLDPLTPEALRTASPLTRYIEENRESGLPIHELVEQFQEYDCDHRFRRTAVIASHDDPQHWVTCSHCSLTEKRKGIGSKSMDAAPYEVRHYFG